MRALSALALAAGAAAVSTDTRVKHVIVSPPGLARWQGASMCYKLVPANSPRSTLDARRGLRPLLHRACRKCAAVCVLRSNLWDVIRPPSTSLLPVAPRASACRVQVIMMENHR